MSGLRSKQKAARDKRILDTAVRKFRAEGYRTVRIEDLAEEAEVAVGTVYNYYKTKGDILIAVVALEVTEVLASGEAIIANPRDGVAPPLLALIFEYFDHSLNYLTKEMWRSAMALSIEAPGTPNGQRYTALDQELAAQVSALIEALQTRGDIRLDLKPKALGQVLFNVLNQEFVEFVKDDAMTLEALRGRVADQISPIAMLMSAAD